MGDVRFILKYVFYLIFLYSVRHIYAHTHAYFATVYSYM